MLGSKRGGRALAPLLLALAAGCASLPEYRPAGELAFADDPGAADFTIGVLTGPVVVAAIGGVAVRRRRTVERSISKVLSSSSPLRRERVRRASAPCSRSWPTRVHR